MGIGLLENIGAEQGVVIPPVQPDAMPIKVSNVVAGAPGEESNKPNPISGNVPRTPESEVPPVVRCGERTIGPIQRNFRYNNPKNGWFKRKMEEIGGQVGAPSDNQNTAVNAAVAYDFCEEWRYGKAVDLENMLVVKEQLDRWIGMYESFAEAMGVDLSQMSRIDPDLSLRDSFRARFTPFPELLRDVILDEGQLAAISRIDSLSYQDVWGVYVPFHVLSSSTEASQARLDRRGEVTFIHEYSHFLAVSLMGPDVYYGVGHLGESFARIFELWVSSRCTEDECVLDGSDLSMIDQGIVPGLPSGEDGHSKRLRTILSNPGDSNFFVWANISGRIRSNAGEFGLTVGHIMTLLRDDPNLGLKDLFGCYLGSKSYDEFFQHVREVSSNPEAVEVFVNGVQAQI